MPELSFQITGVDAAVHSVMPALHFRTRIENAPADEAIQALLLNVQIQVQPPQRSYNAREKEKLVELFGAPEIWGQTLRNRLWTNTSISFGAFTGSTEAILAVPCTYDLNVAAAKYFFALEEGEVSLLFLFSGSIFYRTADGRLQIAPISWNNEAVYRMPAQTWHSLMQRHYPDSAWLALRRDIFERLCAYKRKCSVATWEQAMEKLLQSADELDHSQIPETERIDKKAEAVA